MDKLLLKALRRESVPRPPVWLMRQAGRYLPEYQETRKHAGGFLDLCYTPDLATEVTLQPIRRYGFDASILFSDILVIPHGLGQELWFEQGVGPQLTPLKDKADFDKLDPTILHDKLAPVYQTVRNLSEQLPKETTLIGFCGAPWTVATYMLEGGGSKQYVHSKTWLYHEPRLFDDLMTLLVDASVSYLLRQIEAGAEVVQIFDSWAGVHSPEGFERAVKGPLLAMARQIKDVYPDVPIMLFPKGAHPAQLEDLVITGKGLFDCIGMDTTQDMKWAHDVLQDEITIQGNLDPVLLLGDKHLVQQKVETLLNTCATKPGYIFNLGHGILPQTPPENVEVLVNTIKNWEHHA